MIRDDAGSQSRSLNKRRRPCVHTLFVLFDFCAAEKSRCLRGQWGQSVHSGWSVKPSREARPLWRRGMLAMGRDIIGTVSRSHGGADEQQHCLLRSSTRMCLLSCCRVLGTCAASNRWQQPSSGEGRAAPRGRVLRSSGKRATPNHSLVGASSTYSYSTQDKLAVLTEQDPSRNAKQRKGCRRWR